MSDTKFINIVIKACVLELGAIVASDMLDLDAIIRHGMVCEPPEDTRHFSLEGNDMHPAVTRIIVNYDESIERCCIG